MPSLFRIHFSLQMGACAALCFSGPATSLAETFAAAEVQLDSVEVTAARVSSPFLPNVDEARQLLRLAPGATEVVEADRYLRGRASTLADTFALSPGVFAQPRFGSDEARLSIRGSGLQRTFHGRGIRVLQDGMPVNLADGGFDMQALEPTAAAYINVWRGANALAHGSATLGGAIEYVSLTAHDFPHRRLRLEAGSFNYLRATVSDGFVHGAADAFATLAYQSQDGFRDHAEQRNVRFFGNAGWRLSPQAETRFYVTAVRTDSELPGNLTKAELEADPTQAAAGNVTGHQKRDFDLLRIANRTTFRTGHTEWNFSAAWSYKDLFHPIFQVVDQLSNDASAGLGVLHRGDLLGRPQRLQAGVIFSRGQTHAAQFVNLAGRAGSLTQNSDQIATNVEAFLEEQLTLEHGFTAVIGANAAHSERRLRRIEGGPASYERDFKRLSPKLGLRWDARDVQVYANVSGSFEPPSFSETVTANTARHAQTATTIELGTRGVRGGVRWDVSVYRARLENELLAIDQDNNPATPDVTVNADRTRHSGVELGLEADLLGQAWSATPKQRIVARLSWTYGRFEFVDDPVFADRKIAGVPPHLLRGELTWESAPGWYAGPTFEWVPQKAFIDHQNTFAADAYALLGFKVGRRQDTGLSWFIEARNLTDKAYAATTGVLADARSQDARQFLPGDGRAVYGGIEYTF